MGLPDFGITERLAGAISGGRTSDLSNAVTGQTSAYTPPTSNQTPAPQYGPQLPYGPAVPKISSTGTSNPAGQVLGVSVSNNGVDQASEDARRREEETRNAINSGYDSYLSGLGGMQNSLQAGQEAEMGSASKTYEQIFGGLTQQKTTNFNKLQAGREAVGTRQAQSIKDLQQNLANTLRGASMQFGAMGAGDTSATRVMLPYAYTKLAGAQEGSIRNQANDQLFQIDQQAQDTELQFSDLWRQTEVDKENQLQGIRNYYSEAIRNVRTAMAQAPLDKANSLASLNQSLLSEAMANLRQLEAENRQKQENLKTWASTKMAELNNAKLQLQNTASFTPQDISWSNLPTMGAQSTANTRSDLSYNPMLLASKRRSEYLG